MCHTLCIFSNRADKIKKQMRRSAAASETGSDRSHNSARQSTEIRVNVASLPMTENVEEKQSYIPRT